MCLWDSFSHAAQEGLKIWYTPPRIALRKVMYEKVLQWAETGPRVLIPRNCKCYFIWQSISSCSGLFGWTLNQSQEPLQEGDRGRCDTHTGRGGKVVTESEIGGRWLQIKECWQPPEVARSKHQIFPLNLWRQFSTALTLIAACWSDFGFQASATTRE